VESERRKENSLYYIMKNAKITTLQIFLVVKDGQSGVRQGRPERRPGAIKLASDV
jgi:hypothetical protein